MSPTHIVSSFLALGPLLLTLCNSYASAPKQFHDLSQDILSLHVIHNQVKAQLPTKGGHNTPTLSANYTHDLEVLHDGLHTIVKDLGDLLEKYKSLTKNCSISFDRLRWGQEDIVELRQRILIHACLLSAFNTSLLCVKLGEQNANPEQQNANFVQHSAQVVVTQEQLGQLFTSAATAMSSSGNTDDKTFQTLAGKQPGNSAGADSGVPKKGWAPWPLNDALQTISASATRVQGYAATLSPWSRGYKQVS